MENHTEPRVEGVDQRLEETSCGWCGIGICISSCMSVRMCGVIVLYARLIIPLFYYEPVTELPR